MAFKMKGYTPFDKKGCKPKSSRAFQKKKGQDCTCWKGHSRVPGTKSCAPGSCEENK